MGVRNQMSREDRAKQFQPFAALKGHMEALHRMEKITVEKLELSEEYEEELNRRMSLVHKGDIITVIYFYKGEYLKRTGMVSRIDRDARNLKIVNTSISFEDIYDILLEKF